MNKKLLALLSTLLLIALGFWGCEGEAETAQEEAADRTRQIADSIAQADSMAIIQDSLDRLKLMEERND